MFFYSIKHDCLNHGSGNGYLSEFLICTLFNVLVSSQCNNGFPQGRPLFFSRYKQRPRKTWIGPDFIDAVFIISFRPTIFWSRGIVIFHLRRYHCSLKKVKSWRNPGLCFLLHFLIEIIVNLQKIQGIWYCSMVWKFVFLQC
jgi:hypothetical protein